MRVRLTVLMTLGHKSPQCPREKPESPLVGRPLLSYPHALVTKAKHCSEDEWQDLVLIDIMSPAAQLTCIYY